MRYQVGDTVLLLHSGEEGEVTEIMNEEMVMVEVEGVEFPVYTDQIDFPYFKRFTEGRKAPPKPQKVYVDNLPKEKTPVENPGQYGVWLTFLPEFDPDIYEDELIHKFKIYLVNHQKQVFFFQYHVNFKGSSEYELSNTLRPNDNFYLHDLLWEDLNDVSGFVLKFSLSKPDATKEPFLEIKIKKNARQFLKKTEEMKISNQPTFSFLLFEKYPDKSIVVLPEFKKKPSGIIKLSGHTRTPESPRSVIDLHIEKLSDDWHGMTNFEMLTLQLQTFEKYYTLATINRQPSLIVVHGVGKGKLRDEIHNLLHNRKEVKSFVNQYHPRYGFGATEIYFQY